MKTRREKKRGRVALNIMMCMVCVGGFLVLSFFSKMEMNLYQEHEWTTAEAVYQKSSSYIEKNTYEDADGGTIEEEETRYKWYYQYEINGKVYNCVVSDNISETPISGENTRTIMVATDNNAVYMLYENEEDFKNAYHSNRKSMLLIWGIVWFFMIFFTNLPRRRR